MDSLIQLLKQKYPFIVVEGVIGVGKTTLATLIAKELHNELVLETFEKNPYLQKFYRNPDKYALPVETFFLNQRFKHQLQLKNEIRNGKNIVSDYAFFKNDIFARVNLKKFDYQMYKIDEYKKSRKLLFPDLLIYLQASIKTLLDHIQKRGRSYEKSISVEYLKKLDVTYAKYLKDLDEYCIKTKKSILSINMNKFDFENDKNLIYSILEQMAELKYGTNVFNL